MRQMAKETHIKTDKNPLLAGVLGSYLTSLEYSGSHNGEATYELSLASAGALAFTSL